MQQESLKVIIDDDLIMDTNTGIIGSDNSIKKVNTLPMDEIFEEIDRVEDAIDDLESSLNSRTTSRISMPGREGIYSGSGLLTNIVMGVIFALIIIILLI